MNNKNRLAARERYGIFVAFVGIFVNLILSAAKFAAGLFSGSVSILADALNNLSDAGTSAIMLIGFRIAAAPADEEHPFGHGRAEYLSGFLISSAMIFFGVELLGSSAKKIFFPETLTIEIFVLAVPIISVVAKFALAIFYRRAGNKIHSSAILVAAADSFTDCLATSATIISTICYMNFGINIDGAAGAIISVFVIFSGWKMLREVLNPLLGERPTPELIDGIKKTVTAVPEVLGVHDLIIHSYGPTKIFVSMHVEMSADLKLLAAHEIIDRLERKLCAKFNIFVTLHIDPTVRGDKDFDELINFSKKILSEIDETLSLHDFRVVPYKEGRKLIFDVIVPQNFSMSDRTIRKEFQRRLISVRPKFRAVIHFDHQYC